LHTLYPHLGYDTESGFQPAVNLFGYENQAHKIVDLTGGFNTLQKFIGQYTARMARYKHQPLKSPVIVLVDNDNAVTSLKSNLQKNFGVLVDLTSTESFYHLTSNLYLIKTPEHGATGISCIEDCFSEALKTTLLDGKTFNPEKNIDVATEYGKAPFAEKVVVPRANEINWDGFRPVLDRVSAVIAHYAPPASAIVSKAA
jgi:RNA-directed DNA polymerase